MEAKKAMHEITHPVVRYFQEAGLVALAGKMMQKTVDPYRPLPSVPNSLVAWGLGLELEHQWTLRTHPQQMESFVF